MHGPRSPGCRRSRARAHTAVSAARWNHAPGYEPALRSDMRASCLQTHRLQPLWHAFSLRPCTRMSASAHPAAALLRALASAGLAGVPRCEQLQVARLIHSTSRRQGDSAGWAPRLTLPAMIQGACGAYARRPRTRTRPATPCSSPRTAASRLLLPARSRRTDRWHDPDLLRS